MRPPLEDRTAARTSAVIRWVTERRASSWMSLSVGLLAALLAAPSFTDPWPSNLGGFVFVLVVVTTVLRGAIVLGQAFLQGWREPRSRQLGDH